MVITGSELTALVGSFLWPLFRVSAVVMTAPIFGAKTVPMRIKLFVSLVLTSVVVPLLPPMPEVEVFSLQGLYVTANQILIGVAIGFTTQLVFAAIITAGQIVAMQMGLGFSLMVDPQNGTQAPVVSQFYIIFVVLIFLSLNGHLVLVQIMVDGFETLPIAITGLSADSLWGIVTWGAYIFSGAIGIAIPTIASLLVVNLSFGIMTRAAPQLNIFAIGFPITMILGFSLVLLTISNVSPKSNELFLNVYQLIRGFH